MWTNDLQCVYARAQALEALVASWSLHCNNRHPCWCNLLKKVLLQIKRNGVGETVSLLFMPPCLWRLFSPDFGLASIWPWQRPQKKEKKIYRMPENLQDMKITQMYKKYRKSIQEVYQCPGLLFSVKLPKLFIYWTWRKKSRTFGSVDSCPVTTWIRCLGI